MCFTHLHFADAPPGNQLTPGTLSPGLSKCSAHLVRLSYQIVQGQDRYVSPFTYITVYHLTTVRSVAPAKKAKRKQKSSSSESGSSSDAPLKVKLSSGEHPPPHFMKCSDRQHISVAKGKRPAKQQRIEEEEEDEDDEMASDERE